MSQIPHKRDVYLVKECKLQKRKLQKKFHFKIIPICLLNLKAMQLAGQENAQVSSYRRSATRCHHNQCNQMAVHNLSCIPCKESLPHLKFFCKSITCFSIVPGNHGILLLCKHLCCHLLNTD